MFFRFYTSHSFTFHNVRYQKSGIQNNTENEFNYTYLSYTFLIITKNFKNNSFCKPFLTNIDFMIFFGCDDI